jgi:hypothetical protein
MSREAGLELARDSMSAAAITLYLSDREPAEKNR